MTSTPPLPIPCNLSIQTFTAHKSTLLLACLGPWYVRVLSPWKTFPCAVYKANSYSSCKMQLKHLCLCHAPQNQLTASLLHHSYALWVLLLQPISQCITASCSLHLTSRSLALPRQIHPFSFFICSGQHTSKSKIVEEVNYQMKLKVYGSIYYLSHRSFISNSKSKDFVPNRKKIWGK